MLAFRLTPAQAELFFDVCRELHADMPEKRTAVLQAMAELRQVEGITDTKMSEKEYIKHLSDKFGKVMVVKKKE